VQLRRYFAGNPSAEKDCQAFANDFAIYLSVVASVANPGLPAKCVVQIGKEYAMPEVAEHCRQLGAVLCRHSLPAKALAKALPVLLPAFAKLCRKFCMIYNLQLGQYTSPLYLHQMLTFQATI